MALGGLFPSRRRKKISQVDEFKETLASEAHGFGIELSDEVVARLGRYYKILHKWNPRLHLVAPCSPDEFARRHVLESLLLLRYLPPSARVADIGSGAGLPIIPCLIARPDISAMLIESSTRKAVFLREAVNLTGTDGAATIIADRFANVPRPDVDFITSRALDRFAETLPSLIDWSLPNSTLLLFGGEALRPELHRFVNEYTEIPIPDTEKRFLFVLKRTPARSP